MFNCRTTLPFVAAAAPLFAAAAALPCSAAAAVVACDVDTYACCLLLFLFFTLQTVHYFHSDKTFTVISRCVYIHVHVLCNCCRALLCSAAVAVAVVVIPFSIAFHFTLLYFFLTHTVCRDDHKYIDKWRDTHTHTR